LNARDAKAESKAEVELDLNRNLWKHLSSQTIAEQRSIWVFFGRPLDWSVDGVSLLPCRADPHAESM